MGFILNSQFKGSKSFFIPLECVKNFPLSIMSFPFLGIKLKSLFKDYKSLFVMSKFVKAFPFIKEIFCLTNVDNKFSWIKLNGSFICNTGIFIAPECVKNFPLAYISFHICRFESQSLF